MLKDLIKQLATKDLKEQGIYCSIIEMGTGSIVAQSIYDYPGASSIIYKSESPYSKEAQCERFGVSGYRAVSLEHVAFVLSKEIFKNLDDKTILITSFQIGDSNSDVATHGYIGIYKNNEIRHYHVSINKKETRTLLMEEIAFICLSLMCDKISNLAIDAVYNSNLTFLLAETLNYMTHYFDNDVQLDLDFCQVYTNGKPKRLEDIFRDTNQILIFKGSFNPPHKTHIKLIKTAKKYLGSNVGIAFMISISTREKNTLSMSEIKERIEYINELGYPLIINYDGFFNNNTAYLRRKFLQPINWLCGIDTLNRVIRDDNLDLDDIEDNVAFIEDVYSNCNFLYFNRLGYEPICDLSPYKMFIQISEEVNDDNSTMIRNTTDIDILEKYLPSEIVNLYLRNKFERKG